jgi:hypothetical protein
MTRDIEGRPERLIGLQRRRDYPRVGNLQMIMPPKQSASLRFAN